jgi:hypothetical protein
MIILPRQARDKHRGKALKTRYVRTNQVYLNTADLAFVQATWPHLVHAAQWQVQRTVVRKAPFWAPFYTKNDRFAETGSGQT